MLQLKQKRFRWFSKLTLIIFLGVTFVINSNCQYNANVNAFKDVFKADLKEIINEAEGSKKIVITLKNISSQMQLISLSQSNLHSITSDVLISLSYSHITDPLLMPKLQMPWYSLKPNESIEISEVVKVEEIKKVGFVIDFLPKENYPYKKLKKGRLKKYYWFIRRLEGKDLKKDFYIIRLKDYNRLFFNGTEIHNFYREFEIYN